MGQVFTCRAGRYKIDRFLTLHSKEYDKKYVPHYLGLDIVCINLIFQSYKEFTC